MKYTLAIVSVILPFAVTWAIMYLICAFVNVSWNIAEWTQQARIVCAIWGTAAGVGLWYRLEYKNDRLF